VNEFVERLVGSVELALPEVALIVIACVYFLIAPFLLDTSRDGRSGEGPSYLKHLWATATLAAIAVAGSLWLRMEPTAEALPGPFRIDGLSWYVRGLSLASAAILTLVAWARVPAGKAAEFYACLLFICAGTSLVAVANDLVMLFLALELVSLPTYVLLYLSRHDAAGQEATLKYFLLSVFSAAVASFGLSYLYGTTGTTDLVAMKTALALGANGPMPATLAIGIAAIVAGLAFRLAAAPFHFYAPDVFQGTSTVGAATLSFIPKAVGIVALARIIGTPEALATGGWSLTAVAAPMLAALAVLSMCVGNLLALVQTDLRRLLAYSGIAHGGYMLVGLVAMNPTEPGVGLGSALFYLASYGAMTVGAFAVLAMLRVRGTTDVDAPANAPVDDRVNTIDDLAGLGRSQPFAAALLAIALFSMIGLPPTAGFLGKLNLFVAAWSGGWRWLAIAMLVNAGIAAYYYLRVLGSMYLRPTANVDRRSVEWPALAGGTLCAAATIGLFAAPDWLWQALRATGNDL
jgi:NADH-quinone oxidoreductase subunit N